MNPLSRFVSVFAVLAALATPAMAISIVDTSAPAVNYVFSPTGIVYPTDMGSPLLNGGNMQSRYFKGQPGSPAAGKWVYEYRLDLTNSVGILSVRYASGMNFDFGPVLAYDYNFDSVASDNLYNITSGGLGTIRVSSAGQLFGRLYVTFASDVYGGAHAGEGQSTYFWGLVSDYPPRVVTATVNIDSGTTTVNVYAPSHP